MISTVTTSTVSTITIMGSFAIIGILVLLGLLVQKEIATTSESKQAKLLGKALNIGIAPLLIAFVLITIFKVLEVFR